MTCKVSWLRLSSLTDGDPTQRPGSVECAQFAPPEPAPVRIHRITQNGAGGHDMQED